MGLKHLEMSSSREIDLADSAQTISHDRWNTIERMKPSEFAGCSSMH
jgi:hypothetical protein